MDEGVIFDIEYYFKVEDIELMVIYGINFGMGIKVFEKILMVE